MQLQHKSPPGKETNQTKNIQCIFASEFWKKLTKQIKAIEDREMQSVFLQKSFKIFLKKLNNVQVKAHRKKFSRSCTSCTWL